MKKRFAVLTAICLVALSLNSCHFTLNGASTTGLKTIYVGYFENDAPLVVSNLSNDFTEALKNRIRTTTNLSIVQTQQADAVLTGSIIGYSIAPVSVQANSNSNTPPIASASAVTVTVQVKYINNVDKRLSYEQTFSEPMNYTGDLASQLPKILPTLETQLTEDIFNKAFANW
jgi:hypothetical protein